MSVLPPEDLEKIVMPENVSEEQYNDWIELNGLGYLMEMFCHCKTQWGGDWAMGENYIFGDPTSGGDQDAHACKWVIEKAYLLRKEKVKRFLNVGCNLGFFNLAIARMFPELEIHGIDKSMGLVGCAIGLKSKFCVPNAFYESRDGINTYYSDKKFDISYSMHVLEHMTSVYKFLEEQKRIAKCVCGYAPVNDNDGNSQHIFILTEEYVTRCMEKLYGVGNYEVKIFEPVPPHKLTIVGWAGWDEGSR